MTISFLTYVYLSICLSVYLINCLLFCLFIYKVIIIVCFCLNVHPDSYIYLSISGCLPVYLSICLSIYLPIFLSVYLAIFLSVYLLICLSVYLSICLSVCLFVYLLPVHIFIFLSVRLFTYVSVYLLSVYLFICISAYLAVCLYVNLSNISWCLLNLFTKDRRISFKCFILCDCELL